MYKRRCPYIKKIIEHYVCPSCDFEFWINTKDDYDMVPYCPRCSCEVILSNGEHQIETNTELLRQYWITFYNVKLFPEDTCPKCDGSLIMRHNRKGEEFWGCSNYPDCEYAQRISMRQSRRRALNRLNKYFKEEDKDGNESPIPF